MQTLTDLPQLLREPEYRVEGPLKVTGSARYTADVQMPGIDGVEVCRRLRANERTRALPILFVTALNDTDARVTAKHCGRCRRLPARKCR